MKRHIKNFLLFLGVSLLFRGLYLCLFYDRHSYDIVNWNLSAAALQRGENPYHTTILNWPPLWMQLLFLFNKIAVFLHVLLVEVIRGFLIIVESALAALLYATLIRHTESKEPVKVLVVGLAVNPIAILQVCQHCNFDVLVGFWILLAVYMLLRFQEQHEAGFWLLACFALGMGALTKTVPLCLSPLLLLSVRKLKLAEQVLGAVLLAGPILLGLSIVYVLTPADITAKVLNYRSTPGYFGFSGLFTLFNLPHLQAVWPRVFEAIYGLGWLALGAGLLTKETLGRRQIVSLAAGLLLAIAALGPGYGLQYIYWFLPLLVLHYELAERRTKFFLLALYAVAAVTYAVEYGMNEVAYGAFLLDLTRNEKMLHWGAVISSPAGEALLCLPLWLLYCWYVAACCRDTGREMLKDGKAGPAGN